MVLHHNGTSNTGITINSITVKAYSDDKFTTEIGSKTVNNDCASAGDVTITPDASWATGAYIKILVNWTVKGKSNYGLDVTGFDVYIESNKSESGIAYSTDSYLATIGAANTFPTLSNSNSLTAEYSSSNEDVATVNSTTGAITLVAAGKTTITATTAETATYAAGLASYTLRVLEPIDLTSETVVEKWASLAYGNEDVYVTDGVSFLVNQGSMNNSALQLKASEGYVISPTINAPLGYTVTVTFASGTNQSSNTQIQINGETPVSVTGKTTLVASTSAAVSTFKISNTNAGVAQIATITITPTTPPAPTPTYTEQSLTVVAQGEMPMATDLGSSSYPGFFATFSSDKDVFIPMMDDSYEFTTYVYTVFTDGEDLLLEDAEDAFIYEDEETGLPGYYVPANNGVLLFVTTEEEGNSITIPYYEIENVEVADLSEDNMLRAASVAKENDGSYKFYKLAYSDSSKNPSTLGFYWGAANGGKFESREGSAYLAVPNTSVKGFSFADMETAIKNVVDQKAENTKIFNLQGQRVNAAQKGLYIINGKKVVK